jgi:hypothetical protein
LPKDAAVDDTGISGCCLLCCANKVNVKEGIIPKNNSNVAFLMCEMV